ncbi:hypothetical protein ACOSQ2_024192 [Xanthoceras sorbifolium]
MASRGANALLSRAIRMETKLKSVLEASVLEIEDVSHQHAGHAGVKGSEGETHFNVRIVSPNFEGQSLVKRHRMVYGALADELQSGLHALSIVAKTPQEVDPMFRSHNMIFIDAVAILLVFFESHPQVSLVAGSSVSGILMDKQQHGGGNLWLLDVTAIFCP